MASEELRDWRQGLSLRQRQKYMFDGKYGCDVTFLVGQGKKQKSIAAHRFVLTCGSSVFEEMLERCQVTDRQPIVVVDIEPDVFRTMLQFLYCEEVKLTYWNALSLLAASKIYHVFELAEKCNQFLHDNLEVSNVCKILTECLKYKETELSAKCMDVIHQHTPEVLRSDEFDFLSRESLMKILESDKTSGVTESEIYTACLKWADVQCRNRQEELNDSNRRAVLGEVLYQIRFTTMRAAEFSQLTCNSSVLNRFERLYVHDYIATAGKSPDAASYGCGEFNRAGRNPVRQDLDGQEVFIKRFGSIKPASRTRWSYPRRLPDIIDFTSNRNTTLVGAGLYGGGKPSTHTVQVKLVDDTETIVAETGTVIMTSDGTSEPCLIRFPSPVNISANVRYSVRAYIEGPYTFWGTDGRVDVTKGGVSITFYMSDFSVPDGTSLHSGQLPLLILMA